MPAPISTVIYFFPYIFLFFSSAFKIQRETKIQCPLFLRENSSIFIYFRSEFNSSHKKCPQKFPLRPCVYFPLAMTFDLEGTEAEHKSGYLESIMISSKNYGKEHNQLKNSKIADKKNEPRPFQRGGVNSSHNNHYTWHTGDRPLVLPGRNSLFGAAWKHRGSPGYLFALLLSFLSENNSTEFT